MSRFCTAVPPGGRPQTMSSRRSKSHKHLLAVHFTPDCDRAADGGAAAGRPRCLSAAAGGSSCRMSTFPTLQVTAQLPGADPQTMASSVATPLEQQFGQIPGLTQMTSSSALGFTQISLQFDLNRNVDGAATDTLSAINAASAQLPLNLPYPPHDPKGQSGRHTDPGAGDHLRFSAAHHSRRLRRKHTAPKISQIAGVGQVGIGGQQKPAIRVQVDPAGPGIARDQPGGRAQRPQPGQCRSSQRHAQQP